MGLIRRTDRQAEFAGFAEQHVAQLLRTAFLMVGDQGDAEEMVQECLLRIARRWPRVRAMSHPGSYARRVLFNLILDGSGKRSRLQQELQDSPSQELLDQSADAQADEHMDVAAALSCLPERQRAVLVLRYYADLPESEIATVLGCAPGTVKSSAARGLAALRGALEASRDHETDDATQGAQPCTPR